MLVLLVIVTIIILVALIIWYLIKLSNYYNYPVEDTFEEVESFAESGIPVYIVTLERKPERYEYVAKQLENMGITNYQKWLAVDGFNLSEEELVNFGLKPELAKRKGIAGCAASHISIWKHIRDNNLNWTLILEDDAHFHPDFNKLFGHYWGKTPKNAKMVFPGFCGNVSNYPKNRAVLKRNVMCTHGYMVNAKSAEYLLNNLLPMVDPVDIELSNLFRHKNGMVVFNEKYVVDGICPADYREKNGKKCMFNGIIFQNHQEMGSTIHGKDTVF